MKIILMLLNYSLFTFMGFSQNVGIGTNAPAYKLHIIDGEIGLTNNLSGGTWSIGQNPASPSMFFTYNGTSRLVITSTGNVGIGTTAPIHKLDISGNLKATNFFTFGNIGAGTDNPTYRLHLLDGVFGLTNTTDNVTWSIGYNSTNNYQYFAYQGGSRMVIQNGGNVGINTTTPAYKLDVNGSFRSASASIEGNLLVNDGYGVLRNGTSGTTLKYNTFTSAFSFTSFGGHSLAGPYTVYFPSNFDFVSAPRVMVANHTYIAGSAGHLFSIIPAVYEVNKDGFSIYFFNSSSASATMNITLSFVCIGN